MKKYLLLVLFFSFSLFLSAQSNLFTEVKKNIREKNPDLSLNDKLIAVNLWNVKDLESRARNRAFENVYTTYYQAKLKGGSKGIIVVLVNEDDLSEMAVIGLTKDNVVNSISSGSSEFESAELKTIKNIVFDSKGKIVFQDLASDEVFSSINSLIIR